MAIQAHNQTAGKGKYVHFPKIVGQGFLNDIDPGGPEASRWILC